MTNVKHALRILLSNIPICVKRRLIKGHLSLKPMTFTPILISLLSLSLNIMHTLARFITSVVIRIDLKVIGPLNESLKA